MKATWVRLMVYWMWKCSWGSKQNFLVMCLYHRSWVLEKLHMQQKLYGLQEQWRNPLNCRSQVLEQPRARMVEGGAETRKRSPSYSGVPVVPCTTWHCQSRNRATWEGIHTNSPISFVLRGQWRTDLELRSNTFFKNDTAYIIRIKLYVELET